MRQAAESISQKRWSEVNNESGAENSSRISMREQRSRSGEQLQDMGGWWQHTPCWTTVTSAFFHCRLLGRLVLGRDCGLAMAVQLPQLVLRIPRKAESCVDTLKIKCIIQRDFAEQTWAMQLIVVMWRQRLGSADDILAELAILHHACGESHAIIRLIMAKSFSKRFNRLDTHVAVPVLIRTTAWPTISADMIPNRKTKCKRGENLLRSPDKETKARSVMFMKNSLARLQATEQHKQTLDHAHVNKIIDCNLLPFVDFQARVSESSNILRKYISIAKPLIVLSFEMRTSAIIGTNFLGFYKGKRLTP
jgi:hypothetical protein